MLHTATESRPGHHWPVGDRPRASLRRRSPRESDTMAQMQSKASEDTPGGDRTSSGSEKHRTEARRRSPQRRSRGTALATFCPCSGSVCSHTACPCPGDGVCRLTGLGGLKTEARAPTAQWQAQLALSKCLTVYDLASPPPSLSLCYSPFPACCSAFHWKERTLWFYKCLKATGLQEK